SLTRPVILLEIHIGKLTAFGDDVRPNVMKTDVPEEAFVRRLRGGRVSARPVAQVDRNRARYVLQQQIRKHNILHSGRRTEMHLNRAAIGFVDDAVGYSNVFRVSASESKDRPARAERAVGYCDKPATAEECARVVLRLHVAVADVDVFGA